MSVADQFGFPLRDGKSHFASSTACFWIGALLVSTFLHVEKIGSSLPARGSLTGEISMCSCSHQHLHHTCRRRPTWSLMLYRALPLATSSTTASADIAGGHGGHGRADLDICGRGHGLARYEAASDLELNFVSKLDSSLHGVVRKEEEEKSDGRQRGLMEKKRKNMRSGAIGDPCRSLSGPGSR
ncbi:uncharacterized protein LOC130139738 [Syzygium oleosum]|uniref:uncharacterized protein LOC130139738 n=1 Tax=Syzygium oleosum TaxID=219896 RepID=UPI0024BAF99F|nr:uncharacterized protein LOC130139738 [Syzygium oleosum]